MKVYQEREHALTMVLLQEYELREGCCLCNWLHVYSSSINSVSNLPIWRTTVSLTLTPSSTLYFAMAFTFIPSILFWNSVEEESNAKFVDRRDRVRRMLDELVELYVWLTKGFSDGVRVKLETAWPVCTFRVSLTEKVLFDLGRGRLVKMWTFTLSDSACSK